MVKLAKLWGIIAIVAVIGVMVLGCKGEAEIWGAEDVNVPKLIECSDCGEVIHECVCISVQNPVATDFIIGNLTQTAGSVTAVTIEPKTGKSNGEITIYYDGSTELPTAAGTYTVTFDVAESTGWNAAKGLNGGMLTINKAAGSFQILADIDITYMPTLTLADLTLPTGYTWNYPATSLHAGNGQQYPATYTDLSGNYTTASGNITVNVAKANGVFGNPLEINITYELMLTLANLSLPLGYAWNVPATSLNVGNGQQFPATYTDPSGNYEAAGGYIKVNVIEASINFPVLAEINKIYTPALKLSDIILPTGYTWNNLATILNAGNGQHFSATYIDPSGNFEPANGNITINVAKATGIFNAHALINIIYTTTLRLSNISLSNGYTWNTPSTSLNAGNEQSFAATYTDPSGNYTAASGNIVINVGKATGAFGNPSAINATYTPTLTLASLSLPTGYAWSNPSTSLNADNGQSFTATYTNPNGNYTTAGGNITVNVAKANGAAVNAPTLASGTRNSIIINTVTPPTNGQIVEYARSTSSTIPSSGWQTELTFSGLSTGVTYYFFARSASNNNYNAGSAVSIQIQVPNTEIVFGESSTKLYLNGNLLQNGGITTFTQSNEVININITSGTYSEIIWYINGDIVAQSSTRTTIRLSRQVPGIYQVTVEATTVDGVKNSSNHYFVIQ